MYLQYTPTDVDIFNFGDDVDSSVHIILRANATTKQLVFVIDAQELIFENAIDTGIWKHITISLPYSASGAIVCKLYIDGKLQSHIPTVGTLEFPKTANYNQCFIAKSTFRGYLDDFRMYQKELTATEAQLLFNSATVVKSPIVEIPQFTIGGTLVKYPRENLTGSTHTYIDGTVVRSRASDFFQSGDAYNAWNAFDGIKHTTRWTTNGRYDGNGNANADRNDFYFKDHSSFYGEYFIIDLGEQIVLDHYIHYGLNGYNTRSPVDFRMYATNDDSAYDNTKSASWVQIHEITGATGYADNTGKTFTLTTTPNPYRYFAIITNKIGGNNGYIEFSELELYGHPSEPLVKKYPRENTTTGQAIDNQQLVYTDGTVVKFKASTTYSSANSNSYRPSNLFDGKKTGTGWVGWSSGANNGGDSTYSSDGTALFTYMSGYPGEWIMIDLGEKIVLQRTDIYPETNDNKRQPKEFRIYASNSQNAFDDGVNNTDWNLIYQGVNPGATNNNDVKSYDILSNVAYRYYFMIVNKVYGASYSVVHFAELELFGFSTTDTIVKKSIANDGQIPQYDATGNALVSYVSNYAGECKMIDLGQDVILKQSAIQPNATKTNQPKEFRIYGTNDDTLFDTENVNDSKWKLIYEGVNPNTEIDNTNYIAAKYPRYPLTAYTTTYPDGSGIVVKVKASSEYNSTNYKVYNVCLIFEKPIINLSISFIHINL